MYSKKFETESIISILHDTKLTDHKGVFKMFQDAIRKLWWNTLYKDLQNYVSSCKLCSETNTGHSPKIPLHSLSVPTAPFSTVHVDLLSFHTPSNVCKYICVIIDGFSRFMVAEKLSSKLSHVVIRTIYEKFILKYGFFENLNILTDNGSEFIGSWAKALYKLLGIRSIRTTVYKPSSKGLCERANRSIIALLRRFVKNNPRKWASKLCYVTLCD